MLKFFILIIEIYLAFILETSVFSDFQLAGVVPDIMMIIVCANAYKKGRLSGSLIGFICGLLIDIVFGNVLGLFAFFYMVIGYLCGYASKIYDYNDSTIPLVLIAVGEYLYNMLYYIVFIFLDGRLNFGFYLYKNIIPRVLYTVLLALILYRPIIALDTLVDDIRSKEERKKKNTTDEFSEIG